MASESPGGTSRQDWELLGLFCVVVVGGLAAWYGACRLVRGLDRETLLLAFDMLLGLWIFGSVTAALLLAPWLRELEARGVLGPNRGGD